MNKKSILIVFVISVFLISLANIAFGQGTTSRITGTVTDSSGGAIAGAMVTLTNEGTGATLTAETNDNGAFTFDLIQASTYTVAVEK
ncbi:MAG: carboxypeptidase-like regulatory domain-containing protein, partial [Acidobacteriota bacterium]|nr:carboxypeptidase-like regulatory domain-containing protein [Acidobacteriota bacterium]